MITLGVNLKKIYHIFITLIIVSHSSLFSQNTSTHSYVKLGTLESFWRSEPVIGRWLSGGQGMIAIPDYMEK